MSEPPEEFGDAILYLALLLVVVSAFSYILLEELGMYDGNITSALPPL